MTKEGCRDANVAVGSAGIKGDESLILVDLSKGILTVLSLICLSKFPL